MENEINLSPKPKTPKKNVVIRAITAIVFSAFYGIFAFILSFATASSYNTADFLTVFLDFFYSWEFTLIVFVFSAVTSAIQIPIGKKMGMRIPELLIPSAFSLVLSAVAAVIHRSAFDMFITAFMLTAFRLLFLIVDLVLRKRAKWIPVCIAGALVCAFMSPLCFSFKDDILRNSTGKPDRTGSWGAINQEISRGEDWKQIVTDSMFQLGKIERDPMFEENDDFFVQTLGTYPALDGSTVCVPLAVEFARQHLGMNDKEATSFVQFNTTHDAYIALVNETENNTSYFSDERYVSVLSEHGPDLILVTEPSKAELEWAKACDVEFVIKPVCYDAFVFITHKDNPVESLTVEQIKDIYSGKITNWKEVGGNDEKIKAYQREENSGSQTAMENLVMGGVGMIDPIKVPVITGMGMLVDMVAEYDNETSSIGYTYKYYIDTLYKNDHIKTIAIEGVLPTNDSIRKSEYMFSTNYYGVIRKGNEEKTGGKFLDWILSEEGQKCVRQAGYITLTETD